jgi:SAM-dependent methyltransferase
VFPFEPASFDAAFSRFGVMFFADPTAAFINIRRSLRPNGRLAFACWRALVENPLDSLPLSAASAHLPPQSAHDPDAPGPFAFANPDRVRGILERSGWQRRPRYDAGGLFAGRRSRQDSSGKSRTPGGGASGRAIRACRIRWT